jgi:hypothetical protein
MVLPYSNLFEPTEGRGGSTLPRSAPATPTDEEWRRTAIT